MSAAQTLAIPEVLEVILLELPIRDLLTAAQLVSKTWNTIISSSTPLEQKLFFAPIREQEDPELNPLLKWAFPPWFFPNEYGRSSAFIRLDWISSPEKTAAYSRKEASWRRMLPVQPPATIFEVTNRAFSRTGSYFKNGEVEFPEGVRMGTLYDYAHVTVSKPISSFAMKHAGMMVLDMNVGAVKLAVGRIRMETRHTVQCKRGMKPDVGEEFRSEGFEKLEVKFGEKTNTR